MELLTGYDQRALRSELELRCGSDPICLQKLEAAFEGCTKTWDERKHRSFYNRGATERCVTKAIAPR